MIGQKRQLPDPAEADLKARQSKKNKATTSTPQQDGSETPDSTQKPCSDTSEYLMNKPKPKGQGLFGIRNKARKERRK